MMKRPSIFTMMLCLVLIGVGVITLAQQMKGASAKSHEQARAVLDAGIEAMGGIEVLRSIRDISRKVRGTRFHQGQSLSPETPYHKAPLEITSVVDFAGNRSMEEMATIYIGGTRIKRRQVLKGEAGFGVDFMTGAAYPLTPSGVASARADLRRYPEVLLLRALSRSETLRPMGTREYEGKSHQVITFADSDGSQIGLFFNAQTRWLTKYEILADHPIFGDSLSEFIFSDYRSVDGITLPFRLIVKNVGEVVQDLTTVEVRLNTNPSAGEFEIPEGLERGAPREGPLSVTVTRLADDVYFVGGTTYSSLFVVFQDYVLVVEAPLSDDRSQIVIAKIKEIAPHKPIKYLVPTHYHIDHLGGIRGYMAEGATIVTTPGNRSFIEKVAATPHTIKPDTLARNPRTPVIETFTDKRVFSDGVHTVELYNIGPNPHVAEPVIAYLPKEKIVFESDLFNLPPEGKIPPASEATVAFAEKIRDLGLLVDRIVAGHVRVGTMADLHQALQRRATEDGGRGFVGFIHERALTWRPFEIHGIPSGIEVKLLSRDAWTGAVSMLARYPAGWGREQTGYHMSDEEVFILEGDLKIGQKTLTERCYTYIPAGLAHGPVSTNQGCVALQFFSGEPDFVPSKESKTEARVREFVEYKNFYEEPWVPSVELGFGRLPGIFMKILRQDKETGAMTWIAGSLAGRPPRKWEAHATWEEAYCLEGEFRLAECLPGGIKIGDLSRGSYFFRPAGIRHVGPLSGTSTYVLWFFRTPAKLQTEYFDECLEASSLTR